MEAFRLEDWSKRLGRLRRVVFLLRFGRRLRILFLHLLLLLELSLFGVVFSLQILELLLVLLIEPLLRCVIGGFLCQSALILLLLLFDLLAFQILLSAQILDLLLMLLIKLRICIRWVNSLSVVCGVASVCGVDRRVGPGCRRTIGVGFVVGIRHGRSAAFVDSIIRGVRIIRRNRPVGVGLYTFSLS